MRSTFLSMLTIALVLAVSGFCSALEYEIYDLGEISTFGDFALSINDSGQVAGTSTDYSAFVWDPCSQMRDYITGGEDTDWANDLNDDVLVVGAEMDASFINTYPFYWQEGMGKTLLPTLTPQTNGEALGVNTAGVIAGYVFKAGSESRFTIASLWKEGTAGKEIFTIDKLDAEDNFNVATAINDSNQVVGYSGNLDADRKMAFILEEGQIPLALPLPIGHIAAEAHAINNAGTAAGYSVAEIVAPEAAEAVLLSIDGVTEAVVWQAGGVMTLFAEGIESWAAGINDANQVVGTFIATEGPRAFLWEEGVMDPNLNKLLPAGSTWILEEAHDINNSGWIVGLGINPDQQANHGFLLVPSEDGEEETIPAVVEITPKTVNRKSNSKWITVFIYLPAEYDIYDIVTTSILLNGTVEADKTVVDEGESRLLIKFPGDEVRDLLNIGDNTLTVTGDIVGDMQFEGSDTIRVIK